MGEELSEMAIPIKEILDRMLFMSRAKFDAKLRAEMMNCGALFKVRNGNPPRVHLMGFPSQVRRYISLRASKGETL